MNKFKENIDWKYLSTTYGYKSLKEAYINTIQRKKSFKSKQLLYKKFQWVISRAKHYACTTGVSIESILNGWENDRTYSWENYYQENRQPRFHSNCKQKSNEFVQHQHQYASAKKKKRW